MRSKRDKIIGIIITVAVALIILLNITLSVVLLLDGGRDTDDSASITPSEETDNGDSDDSTENGAVNTANKGKITSAEITDFNNIIFTLSTLTDNASAPSVEVLIDGVKAEISEVSAVDTNTKSGAVKLTEKINPSATYELFVEGYGSKIAIPTSIFDTDYFNENYIYTADGLGTRTSDGVTTFKLWSPCAKEITLNLFSTTDNEANSSVKMSKTAGGVWYYEGICPVGTQYTYTVKTAYGTSEIADPYAKALTADKKRSIVIDTTALTPDKWGEKLDTGIDSYREAIICEIDIGAFSGSLSDSEYKGKYLALTERGLVNEHGEAVGTDYLIDLGISHVLIGQSYRNIPSVSYATSPISVATEFQGMVSALHSLGIGVIVTVDYSELPLDEAVPYYTNSTARYMNEKFILDNIKAWLNEYNVDGLRIKNMDTLPLELAEKIEKTAHLINPNAIVIGEYGSENGTPYEEIGKIEATNGAIGAVAILSNALHGALTGNGGYLGENPKNHTDALRLAILGSLSDEYNPIAVNQLSTIESALWKELSESDGSRYRLALTLLMSSHTAIKLTLGEEFFSDATNIDWSKINPSSDTYDTVEFYRDLLKLRKGSTVFTDNESEITCTKSIDGALTVKIRGKNGFSAMIVANPTSNTKVTDLEGEWYQISDGLSFLVGDESKKSVTIDSWCAVILVNKNFRDALSGF